MPPTQKRTSSHKKMRSAHAALRQSALNNCENCGKPKRPHFACQACGAHKTAAQKK